MAKDLSVKIKVDMSEFDENIAKMQQAVDRLAGVTDRTIPLALLGAYAASTQLRRPMSRRSLLTGGLG